MKNCTSEEMNNHEKNQLDITTSCKNSLAKLKENTWKQRLAKIAHNWRTRNRLSQLNDAQLKDLGLTAADVDQEVRKPVWK
ncbi:Uncharacterized conserved protein YjiS, DUF1127 family [Marinomonas polaris DSM 16579]|uniref:Uncharacterized conserved protein YjiS, DUF1127 family n=1 Tax=Marinomonas polaris DSM 16579 TaxID=1122206 RepID=A0A1M5G3N4_9GAMM|nr:DUF1127 domain-containing protein [Marinomonas polaris]SHF98333.1 Uncharacterized conserved protein YjiS, DUF1127 family [Marinomonas polaris DSM 16579]